MTVPPPPPGPGYGPPPAAAGDDKTTLWGVLGIVFGFCCPLLGVIFGVLSQREATKVGKPATLAYIAYVISALAFIGGIVYQTSLR
jgi:hypothetical protein